MNNESREIQSRAFAHARDNNWSPTDDGRHWRRPPGLGGLTGVPTAHLDGMFDHDDHCYMCKRWIEYGTSVKVDKKLRERQACFECSHLLDHVDHANDNLHIVTDDGACRYGYWVGAQTTSTPSHCRGHGGMKFTIAFNDGRVVETVDLWCWATNIPEYFFGLLPVNAKFVR